jgi:hypothetical protein
MNILKSDGLGVPSTLVAIFANVSQVIGIGFINMFFTWIISILSIIYLIYKIKNEKGKFDSNKNEEGN